MLRLIGQAKEKNKTQLFFDCCFHEGRYYIFAESSRSGSVISYFGEDKPELTFKEKIEQDGLKNNYTEYIPLEKAPEGKNQEKMPKYMSIGGALQSSAGFGQSMRSQMGRTNDKALDELREHFVEFLVGARKWSNIKFSIARVQPSFNC